METITNKSSISNILKFGLILFFPLRDAVGFYLGDIPLRLGEIWGVFFAIFLFFPRKVKKEEIQILLVLLFNLFLTMIGIILNKGEINQSYAVKYTLRNILYLMLLSGFLCSPIVFSRKDIDIAMKYSFFVQLCAFCLFYAFGLYFYMGQIYGWNDILASGQYVKIYGRIVPRFVGTSSEPGYLAAFLPMLLYYFIVANTKHRYFYIIATSMMILFTFSAAVYIATATIVVVIIISHRTKKRYSIGLLFIAVFCLGLYFFNQNVRQLMDKFVIDKVISMFSGDGVNYSASDRNTQMINAVKVFHQNSLLQKIIGRGTGGYLFDTMNNGKGLYLYNVEEAYNLYLSTMVDRGIIGLLLVLCLFSCLWKKKIREDNFSCSVFAGLLIQFLHWMITGNLWQVYFWMEIIMLFGYYRWYKAEGLYLCKPVKKGE